MKVILKDFFKVMLYVEIYIVTGFTFFFFLVFFGQKREFDTFRSISHTSNMRGCCERLDLLLFSPFGFDEGRLRYTYTCFNADAG